MKQLPPVTVLIITYSRPDEIRATIAGLQNNLYYDGLINYFIADDCTPDLYLRDLWHWFSDKFPGTSFETIKTSSNSGWGANANNALNRVRDDIILFLEDDRVLTQAIDISPYVALLMEHTGIGLVRLDGIAGHKTVLHTTETDIRDYMPNFRQGMGALGKLNYFLIDSKSTELWCYSNQPHLKHRRFHNHYGLYPEGLRLGETEESFAHMVKDGMTLPDAPALAVTLDATGWWDHIGRSFQHSEADVRRSVIK